MKTLKLTWPIILTVLLFTGCPATDIPVEPDKPPIPSGGGVEQVSDVFIKDSGSETYRINTNDAKYLGDYGHTLWTEVGAQQNPFTSFSAFVTKFSGVETAGYGVVFGSQNNSMLILMINTKSEYIVGELTGNKFTEIISWEESVNLRSGYNQENKIEVRYSDGDKLYTIFFNNHETATFRDDDEPYHTSGKQGYIAVISPMEDFPNKPVSISYKE